MRKNIQLMLINFMTITTKIIEKYKNRIQFSPSKTPYITYHVEKMSNLIKEIKEVIETML